MKDYKCGIMLQDGICVGGNSFEELFAGLNLKDVSKRETWKESARNSTLFGCLVKQVKMYYNLYFPKYTKVSLEPIADVKNSNIYVDSDVQKWALIVKQEITPGWFNKVECRKLMIEEVQKLGQTKIQEELNEFILPIVNNWSLCPIGGTPVFHRECKEDFNGFAKLKDFVNNAKISVGDFIYEMLDKYYYVYLILVAALWVLILWNN